MVVSFGSLEGIKTWKEETRCLYPVISDPERKTYEVFGLARSISKTFCSQVSRFYSEQLMAEGELPEAHLGDDFLQMGGDFMINMTDRSRPKVQFAYPSQSASDRPSNQQILDAIL